MMCIVDNVEHTNKLDISISDAAVTQTVANVQHVFSNFVSQHIYEIFTPHI